MRQTKPVEQIETLTTKMRMQKKVHVMKQAEVKRKMLEYIKRKRKGDFEHTNEESNGKSR